MKIADLTARLDDVTATYRACWTLAGPALQASGADWYPMARAIAVAMAREMGPGSALEHAAGILAALSPRMDWETNVAAAWDVARRGDAARRPTGGAWQTSANMSKALAIRDVASLTDVRYLFNWQSKTYSFYRSIVDPESDAFTLDAWMLRAAGLPESLKGPQYESVESACIDLARALGVSAPTLQAGIWVYVRDALALQPGERVTVDAHGACIAGTGLRGVSREGARLYRLA